LIIRKEHEEIFEEVLVAPIRKHIEVEYAFQDVNDVPDWFEIPEGREKPWGTTHALLSAKENVTTPFMICNADDYYGKKAFKVMADFLNEVADNEASMMGYVLDNTLTDHGTVTRGVCESVDGFLNKIVETEGIKRTDLGVVDGDNNIIPDGTLVSMNFWGFTPDIFNLMEDKFVEFLKDDVNKDPLKAEALLPNDVGDLVEAGKLKVSVLETSDSWFGVTYQEDKPKVLETFKKFQTTGVYPEKLWK